MKWSLPLGRAFGIRIRIHLTFFLILGWVAWVGWTMGGWSGSGWALILVACVFACVILHELSHSVVAMRFGVVVKRITLLPIGGVAEMSAIPEKPYQEFLIAVAGPMMNIVIAGLLVLLRGEGPDWANARVLPATPRELAGVLIQANIVLAVFNLLPAFPMDGGRILRSLLARVFDYARATEIATAIGQVLAVAFVLLGLLYNPILVLIGLFVLFGARSEERMVRIKSALRDVTAEDVMMTDFVALAPQDRLQRCVDVACHRRQEDFPVLSEGRLVGVLPRRTWISAFHATGPDPEVESVMNRHFIVVSRCCAIMKVYQDVMSSPQVVFPVLEEGEVVGLLTAEDLGRYLLIQGVQTRRRQGDGKERSGGASRFSIDLG